MFLPLLLPSPYVLLCPFLYLLLFRFVGGGAIASGISGVGSVGGVGGLDGVVVIVVDFCVGGGVVVDAAASRRRY